jgi:cysteinyl-tRNA synthetase
LTQGSLQAIDGLYGRLAGDVLGLILAGSESRADAGLTPQLIELLIETRKELRKAKAFEQSDRLRDRLTALGVELRDGPEGTTWSLS